MFTKLTNVAAESRIDEFRHECPFEDCPMRTELGPWTYYVTKVRDDFPNHAEVRHQDAERAWEQHIARHHPEHKAQHHKRPTPATRSTPEGTP